VDIRQDRTSQSTARRLGSQDIEEDFFPQLAVPDMVGAHTMRLLVFDPMREEIVEWISCVMSISSTSGIVSFPSGTAYHSALTLLITRLISQ